ncbi:MAG: HD-GYP domain-containing protein, partial [Nitrospiria bacterium]
MSNPAQPTHRIKEAASAEQFLKAITKVLRDRALYPKDHPQVLAKMTDLHTALQHLFSGRNERTFVFIEDQIYIDDLLIGRGDENLSDIARLFLEKQVEVLTLREGLSMDELRSFADVLSASRNEKGEKQNFQSLHLTSGKLKLQKKEGEQVSPILKNLGAAIPKTDLKQVRFREEGKVLKDIYVDWKTAEKGFVKNVGKIMEVLEKSLFANFNSLIPLGSLKSYDEYTYVHAINLSILTMAQAQCWGFSKEAIHAFGIGAVLHDVGKTEVPVEVLHKSGRLTEEEFSEMKSHPLRGAILLLQYPEIPRVAAIIAFEHHLRYDLKGYPAIKHNHPQHIGSRLTALSDQFDAMRSNRPYRDALKADQILEIMEKDKGTGLDPDLF